jgi:hypothetical protein
MALIKGVGCLEGTTPSVFSTMIAWNLNTSETEAYSDIYETCLPQKLPIIDTPPSRDNRAVQEKLFNRHPRKRVEQQHLRPGGKYRGESYIISYCLSY